MTSKDIEREREPGRFHAPVQAGEPVPHVLYQRVVQLIGQVEALVNDEVIEADADAGNWVRL